MSNQPITVAVPDLVTNSYFPAIAAVALGFFAKEGLEAEQRLIYPNVKCYEALRDGAVEFTACPAHAALVAFPEWRGVKLLAALAQGMYWLLIMRADLKCRPGDPGAVKGRRIGAAPLVEMGLRRLLVESGIDPERDGVEIVRIPGGDRPGVSYGVAAAEALAQGKVDGFWANAMGAENAVRSGVGTVVLDVRRGLGPAFAFHYTIPVLATSDAMIARAPDTVAGAVRAVVAAQRALKADVGLATAVGRKLFPAAEAETIARVVERDLPYYDPAISREAVAGVNRFAAAGGLKVGSTPYEAIVATQFSRYWTA